MYGRRTGQIKLKQIPFQHYHKFFPNKSEKELIEYYLITGGVPKYIELFYDSKDIFEREVPITEDNPESCKRGLYKIKDNFMLFGFKFIFPNLNYIESGHAELAMKKIQTNLVDSHIAYVYENVCMEKMWELNVGGMWDFHFDKVGRWWNNNTEIDIVALDKEGGYGKVTLFCFLLMELRTS